jgi:hypothetical protein
MLVRTRLFQPLFGLQKEIETVHFDSLFAFYTCPNSTGGVKDDFYSFGFLFQGFDPLLEQCEVGGRRGCVKEPRGFETTLLVVANISVGNLAVARFCGWKRDEVEEFDIVRVDNCINVRREVSTGLVDSGDVGDEGLRGLESEEDVWATW